MARYQDILPMQRAVEALRERERSRYRAKPLADALSTAARQLRKDSRAFGDLGGVWDDLVPAELSKGTRLRSFSRNTLTVACANATTRYQLDAWLRAGGETSIKRATRAALSRIRPILDDAQEPTP